MLSMRVLNRKCVGGRVGRLSAPISIVHHIRSLHNFLFHCFHVLFVSTKRKEQLLFVDVACNGNVFFMFFLICAFSLITVRWYWRLIIVHCDEMKEKRE